VETVVERDAILRGIVETIVSTLKFGLKLDDLLVGEVQCIRHWTFLCACGI